MPLMVAGEGGVPAVEGGLEADARAHDWGGYACRGLPRSIRPQDGGAHLEKVRGTIRQSAIGTTHCSGSLPESLLAKVLPAPFKPHAPAPQDVERARGSGLGGRLVLGVP